MAFQIMHALGFPIPSKLVDPGAVREAIDIIEYAKCRSVPVQFPNDFWCLNDHNQKQLKLFSALLIPDGWSPVALGPISLETLVSSLSNSKKILWIGPVQFGLSKEDSVGASILAKTLLKLSQEGCDVTVVGNLACKALTRECSVSACNMVENASVFWEFLKGRKLPGLLALDRGYPFEIDWHAIYADPARPLLVDIGSGNGMFIFKMAQRRKDINFLGLEINEKLVKRCLDSVHESGLTNGYFIATNATSTFRSIVSSYPGELIIVSIQCPNPDFNKPEHRWRMLQRSLVEAIADLLVSGGKVFLQSDIEAVALRMKEQFMNHEKRKFTIVCDEDDVGITGKEWLKENPFGVQTDWEEHVIQRGAPMYRLMLSKPPSNL